MTHDRPTRRAGSLRPTAHADFPIQNLPFGVLPPAGDGERRAAASRSATRSSIWRALGAGLLDGEAAVPQAAAGAALNALHGARPRRARRAAPAPVSELLAQPSAQRRRGRRGRRRCCTAAECAHAPAVPRSATTPTSTPASITPTNVGRLFRPDNPLLPNYKYVPIGYHGRASSIGRRGAPVRRPQGQRKRAGRRRAELRPVAAASTTSWSWASGSGRGNALGEPIPIARGRAHHIAGLCLLNDWSARDIQAWEYQPLGPVPGQELRRPRSRPGSSRRRRWRRSASPQPRAAGGRSAAAALSLGRRRPARAARSPSTLEVLLLDRRRCAPRACRRIGCRQQRAPTSTGRVGADGRPPREQRLQPAARRPVRHRHAFPARTRDRLGSLLELSQGGKAPIDPADGETRTLPGRRRRGDLARAAASATASRRSASASAAAWSRAAG